MRCPPRGARRIEESISAGAPITLVDNADEIDAEIERWNDEHPPANGQRRRLRLPSGPPLARRRGPAAFTLAGGETAAKVNAASSAAGPRARSPDHDPRVDWGLKT